MGYITILSRCSFIHSFKFMTYTNVNFYSRRKKGSVISIISTVCVSTITPLPCLLMFDTQTQPDPEEKNFGHFARKGASVSTRERDKSLKRLQPVRDPWLRADSINVWNDRGIGSQHNAHNHSTAEGECSLQEDIGRLHSWKALAWQLMLVC